MQPGRRSAVRMAGSYGERYIGPCAATLAGSGCSKINLCANHFVSPIGGQPPCRLRGSYEPLGRWLWKRRAVPARGATRSSRSSSQYGCIRGSWISSDVGGSRSAMSSASERTPAAASARTYGNTVWPPAVTLER